MATAWMEGCGDATLDATTFWVGNAGTISADTVTFNRTNGGSGAALKLDRTSSNVQASLHTPAATLADAGRRITCWFRFNQLPGQNDDLMRLETSGGASILNIDLTTAAHLHLAIAGGGTGTTTLNPNTWYRIAWGYTITNATTNAFKVWLNGGLEINNTNLTLTNTGSDNLLLTVGTSAGAGSNLVFWFDDLYIDNITDLGDPGDIRVTAKLPSSNNVNNYNTAIGNNPANRWQNVNERPLSQTNGWEDTTGTSQVVENYGLQTAVQGDVDISTFNQIAYLGWMYAKEGAVSGTPQLTVNGTDNAVTLTTSPALYTAITDSSGYPNNAAGIGMKSGNTVTGSFLYECGVQIAYRWTAPGSTAVSILGLNMLGP